MLRLRSLKRGLAIQDRHRGTTKSDLNRFQPSSTILHLRYAQEPLFYVLQVHELIFLLSLMFKS